MHECLLVLMFACLFACLPQVTVPRHPNATHLFPTPRTGSSKCPCLSARSLVIISFMDPDQLEQFIRDYFGRDPRGAVDVFFEVIQLMYWPR